MFGCVCALNIVTFFKINYNKYLCKISQQMIYGISQRYLMVALKCKTQQQITKDIDKTKNGWLWWSLIGQMQRSSF